jgi:xylan 1,4-beta-xylosidase
LLRELAALSPTPVHVRLHNLLTSGDGTRLAQVGIDERLPRGRGGKSHLRLDDHGSNFRRDARFRRRAVGGSGLYAGSAFNSNPEPYRHTFPNTGVAGIFTGWAYPPKDYAKWAALVTAWATHLRDRYGADALRGWLWEVWNEPDIGYWHGTPEEYDHLYDVTSAAIRGVLPDAKIGGPDSTGPGGQRASGFLKQFLDHCAHGTNSATGGVGAPLDFISFHPKGAPKMVDGHVQMGIRNQLAAMDRGMKIVASFPEFATRRSSWEKAIRKDAARARWLTNPIGDVS